MIADYVKRHGGKVVVQFNEGVIAADGMEKVFSIQKDNKYVDLFLCWNEQTANLVNGKNIGNPRFDVYSDELNELIISRELFAERYGLDSNKLTILFGSSFPNAKFSYMLNSFHNNNWKDLGLEHYSTADEFANSQIEGQRFFKTLMLACAASLPEAQIVLKAHPMSDIEMWQTFCDENGFVLIDQEYIFNALNACDIYITKLGSVTVGEAWMLNKPVIRVIADLVTESSGDQMDADHFVFESLREFISVLSEVEENIYLDNDVEFHKYDYMNIWGINPRNSAELTAVEIVELLSGVGELKYSPDLRNFYAVCENHNHNHLGYVIDVYGNHNKAVRTVDVEYWYEQVKEVKNGL
jgi:surface carbohydrate biosynthesis protein